MAANNNIPVSHTTSNHCCVIDNDNDKRRNSCCSHCDKSNYPLNPQDLNALSITPPLDNVYFENDQDQPFSCIYLLNLFLAPDLFRYLRETPVSDDVYDLPIHIQKLVSEARMEVLMDSNTQKNIQALKRLERVRTYVKSVTHGDTSAVIAILNELIHDEDELSTIVGD